MKQQCGISKDIAISEIGKQAKGLQLEPVEMTVQQANCVSIGVFDTQLEASLPVQAPRLYIKKNKFLFMHKS